MVLLIHPTHRKFIKRLRKQTYKDKNIILTNSDIEAIKSLFKTTQKSYKRHQGFYRILLQAINRQQYEDNDIAIIINHSSISLIEKKLRNIEVKNLCTTLRNTLIFPIIKRMLKLILKHEKQ